MRVWWVLAAFFVLALAAAPRVFAAETSTSALALGAAPSSISRSYINPFFNRKIFRIFVLGDSLGVQLWRGLKRKFTGKSDIEIINRSGKRTGFSLTEPVNLVAEVTTLVVLERVDIAVVMFGLYDLRDIKVGANIHKFNSPRWRAIYIERVDRFLDRLNKSKVAVYWIGLPPMRKPRFDDAMRKLTALFKRRVQSRNMKFMEIREAFVDARGGYRRWEPDRNGRRRLIRSKDGVHLSGRGIDKLGDIIGSLIASDINHTKAVRNIQLAGEQEMQTREITAFEGTFDELTSMGGWYEPAPEATLGRGANSAAVVNPEQGGGNMPGGGSKTLEARMRLITSTAVTLNARPARGRKRDRTQMPVQVRVLLMGEALEPKPGRADDFSWPRKD